MRRRPLNFIALIFFSLIICQPSWAGRVVKTKNKGKTVLIKLSKKEAKKIAKGDKLYVTTKSGKKKGLVIVRKKKGRNVFARLKKGKAKKGMRTRLKKSRKKKMQDSGYEDASEVAQVEDPPSGRSDLLFGIMGGFGSATQTVDGVADMSGSTMGFKGLIDYSLFDNLGVRGRFGIDILSVSGSNGGNEYETTINYLTVDLLLRYHVYQTSSFGFFVNAGMGIYSPLSSDLTGTSGPALQEDSISTTSLLIFGLGVTIPMGSWDIFVGGDYFYFPPSDDVSTSAFGGKIGVLFEL